IDGWRPPLSGDAVSQMTTTDRRRGKPIISERSNPMIGKRKDDDNDGTGLFERSRRPLQGLAYRILGSRSDAEDAVQDTFLKWQAADQGAIDNPAAWLTTI